MTSILKQILPSDATTCNQSQNCTKQRRICLDADQIRNLLTDCINTCLEQHQNYHHDTAFTRYTEKLGIENLVDVIFYLTATSLDVELARYFHFSPENTPANSTLTEAREKLSAQFFADVYHLFTDKISEALDNEQFLNKGISFLAGDGSNLSLDSFNKDPEDLKSTSSETKKISSCHINGLYTMDDRPLFLDFILQRCRDKDETEAACQLALRQNENANICFVLDRGYHCFRLEHLIESRNNFYLIRMKEQDFYKLAGQHYRTVDDNSRDFGTNKPAIAGVIVSVRLF